jgi:putative peptidoglycan lipid II flippase
MSFLRASLAVSLMLLVGRFSGFIRDWYLGWEYGAGLESDQAILILTFPDLMVNIVTGGGVAAALVPAFRRLSSGPALGLFLQASVLVIAVFLIISCGVALFPEQLMGLLAPGLPGPAIADGKVFFSIAAFAVPLTAASGVTTAWLYSSEKFQYGSSGNLIFNVCVIGGMMWLGGQGLIYAVTVGVLTGAILRLAIQTAAATRTMRVRASYQDINHASIAWTFFSAMAFTSVIALLPAIARAFASLYDSGALSIFTYATKVIELPIAIAISAVSVVLLPRLALEFGEDGERGKRSAALALRAVTLISLGTAVPAAFFSQTIFRLIFFSSEFSADQIALLGEIFMVGIIFLPMRAALALYTSIFSAKGNTLHLLIAALIMLATLAAALPGFMPYFGLLGVMLAMSAAITSATLYLSIVFGRVFGGDVIRVWFSGFLWNYMLPTMLSVAICWYGASQSSAIVSDIFCGILSFGVFIAMAFGLNRRVWRAPAHVSLGAS